MGATLVTGATLVMGAMLVTADPRHGVCGSRMSSEGEGVRVWVWVGVGVGVGVEGERERCKSKRVVLHAQREWHTALYTVYNRIYGLYTAYYTVAIGCA